MSLITHCFFVGAARASETVRPPQLVQIFSAGLLGRKSPLQLQKVLGVILHALEDYILWLRQSRGYPYFIIFTPLREVINLRNPCPVEPLPYEMFTA